MKYHWKTWSRLALGMALLSVLLLGLGGSVQAGDFRGGDQVVIGADEVIDDDLFVSGNRVEVNGTVKGDLIATAAEVVINGKVEGSLVAGGQTIEMNGQVDGSLYSGGYSLIVGPEAEIGRNVYFGGFSVKTKAGSKVGRSLYAGSYQTILDGDIANDVEVGSSALVLNGFVGGDVKGEVSVSGEAAPPSFFMPGMPMVESVAPGLQVGENAEIGGAVDITEVVEAGTGDDAGESVVVSLGRAFAQRAGEFIALMIVGGLLIQFWPAMVKRAGELAQARLLPSAGWGCIVTLVFFIAVPVVAILIFIVASLGGLITFGQLFGDILGIGGASLALTISIFAFVLSIVTKAIVAFLAGKLILARLAPNMEPGTATATSTTLSTSLWSLALGAFIYEILRVIPFLGWGIGVIVTLVGLGAIYFFIQEMWKAAPPEELATVESAA